MTLYTDLKEVESRIGEARHVYRARNQRLESLTDDSVDTFYSCLLCQSFAPNHVCVITPERLGAIYGVTVEIAQIDRPGGGRTRVCVPSLARPVAY